MTLDQADVSNKLLKALSPAAFAKLSEHLVPLDLPQHFKIAVPKVTCANIVFPDTGIASVIGVTDGVWQEIGLFGSDGAGCLTPLLSSRASLNMVVMQVPGAGHRIDGAVLKAIFVDDTEVRELFLSYLQTVMYQVSQTAIANVQCNAGQRLARWLLMIQDRILTNEMALTHEYVAAMLGIARTSITLALRDLEAQGLISTSRKLIRIEDRSMLLALAGKFYGLPEQEYINVMAARPPIPRSGNPQPDQSISTP